MSKKIEVETGDDILPGVIGGGTGELALVCRSCIQLTECIKYIEMTESNRNIHILIPDVIHKTLDRHHPLAPRITEVIEQEEASIRSNEIAVTLPCLLLDSNNICIVTMEQTQNMISICKPRKDDDVQYNAYSYLWDEGEPISFRIPPISEIIDTAADSLSYGFSHDLYTIYYSSWCETNVQAVNVEEIILLIAAKHELLFFEVKKWAEEIGLSSRSTMSRRKSSLDNVGFLNTEEVSVTVGRPRLRLTLNEDVFHDTSATAIIKTVIQTRGTTE